MAGLRTWCLIMFLWPVFFCVSYQVEAGDSPFQSPNNWGCTGLYEIPTARIMPLNTYRVGISQADPYRYYYVSASLLKGLEIEGRVTEILGTKIQTPGWAGYGNYKDKAVDIKYQFLEEGKWLPALAIGIMDPHGTRLYAGQYVVMSKQIFPFDFTLGLGNGRFGKRPLPSKGEGFQIEIFQDPKQWWEDAQFFGGLNWAINERLNLKMEYNPIDYKSQTQDPAVRNNVLKEPSLKWNFGFNYKVIPDWVELDVSYQRGNTLGFNIYFPFTIGRPMIPIYDHPYKEPVELSASPLDMRISWALATMGFGNIGVNWEGKDLVIDLENYKYFYFGRALDVVLKTLTPILTDDVEKVIIIFKENDIPMYFFETTREDIKLYGKGLITKNQLLYISKLSSDYAQVPKGYKSATQRGIVLGYKPIFQLFLNDPSGFWKGKVGVTGYATKKLATSLNTTLGVSFYPLANISTVNEPLSIPVRTDVVDYLKRKLLFDSWIIEKTYRVPYTDLFLRGTGGILELQYSGADLELAYPLWDGRLLLGTNLAWVKKRDPENPFKFREGEVKDHYRTTFLNLRYHIYELDGYVDIKYGRFLAGDKGTKVTLSKVINGVVISAWYSFTDTDVFQDSINRGYHDKGVSVTMPFRLFTGKETRARYSQGISPWTRDVAQDINHSQNLFDTLDMVSRNSLKRSGKGDI